MMARENFLPLDNLKDEILIMQKHIIGGSTGQLYDQLARLIEGYKVAV